MVEQWERDQLEDFMRAGLGMSEDDIRDTLYPEPEPEVDPWANWEPPVSYSSAPEPDWMEDVMVTDPRDEYDTLPSVNFEGLKPKPYTWAEKILYPLLAIGILAAILLCVFYVCF